jgi:hypothetical protein
MITQHQVKTDWHLYQEQRGKGSPDDIVVVKKGFHATASSKEHVKTLAVSQIRQWP